MFSKLSVKKPFYVLVAAIIVLVLGGVSLSYMKTDLLPEFEVPYLAVITTDIGASPEQVEEEVSDVLESSLSTVSGVQSVFTTSAENYSMIFLEFADDTNMDSALVKVSAACNEVIGQLPESAGTPTYMEISMDLIASMYLGIASDKMDIEELTKYVDETAIPALEREEGVANVSAAGGIVDTIEIRLNQDKIDNVNDGIVGEVNEKLSETKAQLDAGERALDRAEAKLDDAQDALDSQKEAAVEQLATATEGLNTLLATKAAYEAQLAVYQGALKGVTDSIEQAALQVQIEAIKNALEQVKEQISSFGDSALEPMETATDAMGSTLASTYSAAETAKLTGLLTLAEAQNQIDDGKAAIAASRKELAAGRTQFEQARKEALNNANIDKLVDKTTLAQLIQGQNMQAPAGYVEDKNGDQWLVKLGKEYKTSKQLKKMVLTKIEGLGDILLGDVADIVATSNEGQTYAKFNGKQGIILSLTKSSTANNGEVSNNVNAAIDKLVKDNKKIEFVPIMDQGEYIDLYISTILKALLIGAVLAIIVLAVFLRNIRPTLVVAFSIPFSVLLTLVIMYFCGFTLNIMTLGALSVSIGMLVDNSIVAMENIYRMRARGLSAARAAAQGAVQVSGAIVASTLTSVCVFLPFVFTSGTVRQLMVPFALTISFSLLSSLLVALTVVPAIASKIFKNEQPKEYKWFERLQDLYGRSLAVVLKHKAPVLLVAVGLLAGAIALVINMGIVMIPEMTSNQIALIVVMPEDTEKEDAYELMDTIGEKALKVDGIAHIGIADNGATAGTFTGGMTSGTDNYMGRFAIYAVVDPDKVTTETQVIEVQKKLTKACSGYGCEIIDNSSSSSMSSFSGGDVSVDITGLDTEEVRAVAKDVVKVVESVEGYEEVSDGQEDADPALRLVIDKDKVARMGSNVGAIYAELAGKLNTSVKVLTLSNASRNIEVKIVDEDLNNITKENILNTTFTDTSGNKHKLKSVATLEKAEGVSSLTRQNNMYLSQVTAKVADGYNITLLARQLQPKLDKMDVPDGVNIEISGTNETIQDMLNQMFKLFVLGFLLVYLVMVAQFQSLRSPFIIIFTVPLAFTGGLFALVIAHEQLSMMSLLGFVILMGTVVNNGIVFVDYVNQLRLGGMAKRAALIATGRTRMRPIIMTALTTIISMGALIFSDDIGASMQRGMALVVAGGLLYATFMTLYVVPSIYDIMNRKPMVPVDIGPDTDEKADDVEAFIAQMGQDARETYDFESRRARRKRLKAEAAAREAEAAALENPVLTEEDAPAELPEPDAEQASE